MHINWKWPSLWFIFYFSFFNWNELLWLQLLQSIKTIYKFQLFSFFCIAKHIVHNHHRQHLCLRFSKAIDSSYNCATKHLTNQQIDWQSTFILPESFRNMVPMQRLTLSIELPYNSFYKKITTATKNALTAISIENPQRTKKMCHMFIQRVLV